MFTHWACSLGLASAPGESKALFPTEADSTLNKVLKKQGKGREGGLPRRDGCENLSVPWPAGQPEPSWVTVPTPQSLLGR